ncbi:SubName: Full=Uncharacterized protein {ECO:0000313/EMBL:CCA71231.1} [Serendipita indica DSM 11827]|nr:SubName: Full=Uncharacterized protein {ECO:0000313/EMBL:CCA71231.1} [Serendipita indica DSM 11827]
MRIIERKDLPKPPHTIVRRLRLNSKPFAGLEDLPCELLLSIVSDFYEIDEESWLTARVLSALSRRLRRFFGPLASKSLVAIGYQQADRLRHSIKVGDVQRKPIRHLTVLQKYIHPIRSFLGDDEVVPIVNKLHNLTSLTLSNVFVGDLLINALSKLPRLESLEYDVHYP